VDIIQKTFAREEERFLEGNETSPPVLVVHNSRVPSLRAQSIRGLHA
jgi:hypothetical protein